MREAILPERRVAYIGSAEIIKSPNKPVLSNYLSFRPVLAFILAFTMIGSAIFLFISFQLYDPAFWRRLVVTAGLFGLLVTAALRDDKVKFYSTLAQFKKKDPFFWRKIEDENEYSILMKDLEASIYGTQFVASASGLMKQTYKIFKIYLKNLFQHRSLNKTISSHSES